MSVALETHVGGYDGSGDASDWEQWDDSQERKISHAGVLYILEDVGIQRRQREKGLLGYTGGFALGAAGGVVSESILADKPDLSFGTDRVMPRRATGEDLIHLQVRPDIAN